MEILEVSLGGRSYLARGDLASQLAVDKRGSNMSPDKRPPRRGGSRKTAAPPTVKTRPASTDAYEVVYFKRHAEDDPAQETPGRQFLNSCPDKVKSTMMAVAAAVAAAPPQRFAGGGYWEAMHGDMTGYYEIRVDGPKRVHYRLFCRLDTEATEHGPLLVIICGEKKLFRTTFNDSVYTRVRSLGSEYVVRNPRSILG